MTSTSATTISTFFFVWYRRGWHIPPYTRARVCIRAFGVYETASHTAHTAHTFILAVYVKCWGYLTALWRGAVYGNGWFPHRKISSFHTMLSCAVCICQSSETLYRAELWLSNSTKRIVSPKKFTQLHRYKLSFNVVLNLVPCRRVFGYMCRLL